MPRAPLTVELREVDVRDLLFEPNVIGIPPKGVTVGVAPAGFEVVDEVKQRLELSLAAAGRDAVLTVRYGNRKATLRLLDRE